MPSLKHRFLAVVGALFLSFSAQAADDFYAGEVPVNDRSQVSFSRGMNEALLQVLVKASAETPDKLRQNPALRDALAAGERYAAQFLYKVQADPQPDGTVKNQVYLQGNFPEGIIIDLLKKSNVRFWAAGQRPTVLLLPVVISQGLEHMAVIRAPALVEQAQRAARVHGIPLQQADGQEDADQLWQGNAAYVQQLLAASQRQVAVVILAEGEAGNAGKGKWLLFDGEQSLSMVVSADSPARFMDQGMAWVASQLAGKGAVALGAQTSSVELQLAKVDTYAKYEKALAYLKGISIVETVQLGRFHRNTLFLTLKLRTGPEQLDKIFQLDRKLVLAPDAGAQKHYQWNE